MSAVRASISCLKGREFALEDNLIARTVRQVFPAGSSLTWNPDDVAAKARFWIVPGNDGPRWILPSDANLAREFLCQWTPYKPSSLLKWRILLAAYRVRQLRCVPGIIGIGVDVPNGASWTHLGWDLGKPPLPVIYVGSPCRTRKAVVGLVDRLSRRLAAVAKVPLDSEAPEAIRREAAILSRLQNEKPGLSPRPLFVNTTKGIAAQEGIVGRSPSRVLSALHITYLENLVVPGETVSLRTIAERIANELLPSNELDEETRALLDFISSELDSPDLLPAVWIHGDMAPWNLKQTTVGHLKAVDWEFACTRGLPLFDIVYYRTIQMFELGEPYLFPWNIQQWLSRYMKRLSIEFKFFRNIVLACLLVDWHRACSSGDANRAAFLRRQLSVWAKRRK